MERLRVRLISVVILCCIASATQAQFYGGIVGGFTTSQVDGDEHNGFHRLGAYAGLFVMPYSKLPWQHTFELAFSQKGAASTNKEFKTTVAYVDVNYTLQVIPTFWFSNFPEKLSIGIGPTMSVKAYENILLNDIKNSCNDFNRFDFQAHTRINYSIAQGRFGVEAKASYSLIPNDGRYYNFALYFLLRYYMVSRS